MRVGILSVGQHLNKPSALPRSLSKEWSLGDSAGHAGPHILAAGKGYRDTVGIARKPLADNIDVQDQQVENGDSNGEKRHDSNNSHRLLRIRSQE